MLHTQRLRRYSAELGFNGRTAAIGFLSLLAHQIKIGARTTQITFEFLRVVLSISGLFGELRLFALKGGDAAVAVLRFMF